MKTLVLLACLIGTTFAIEEEYGVGQRKYQLDDKFVLERQRDLLDLFQFINEPVYDDNHEKLARFYSIEQNIHSYINSSAVEKFLGLYKQGLLPRGEIFSIFYEPHLAQAISLFKLFYYARDFPVLYRTAIWARKNINEGMFLYSFSTALKQREDTYYLIIPPIYEIYPYYFFNSEDIDKAQRYKQQYRRGNQVNTIFANYSGYYLNLNKEQSISYYLEDIGINSFYYYCNIYYPFWLDGEEFKLKNDRRGEQYYYLYQQLLARYYLERLSNNLGEIEFFNYEDVLPNGYYSSLRYSNGLAFPNRPNFARLTETIANYGQSWSFKSRYGYAYTRVQDFERRLRDSVDAGYVFGKNGKLIDLYSSDQIDLLGSLIESNPDSVNPRYYGPWPVYSRHLLGYSFQPLDEHKLAPSALEHFETALRDPAFYQLSKRIVLICQLYKQNLPPYTHNELYFPGVKIEKVDFDRLFTYFDYFDSDVTNSVYNAPGQRDSFRVKIRQQRLNHKPFTYRIHVNSDTVDDAVVRVYLGPKYDERERVIDINENRVNFVEMDTFRYTLQVGHNTIVRNSRQAFWYVPDRTTYRDLYKKLTESIYSSTKQFQLDSSEAFYGFPNRLLLPKGKREGQKFQIYVIINPYQAPTREDVQQEYNILRVGTGMNYIDNYAFGFPFDRVIVSSDFRVPNSQFVDVVIYHKSVEDLNSSQAQTDLRFV